MKEKKKRIVDNDLQATVIMRCPFQMLELRSRMMEIFSYLFFFSHNKIKQIDETLIVTVNIGMLEK